MQRGVKFCKICAYLINEWPYETVSEQHIIIYKEPQQFNRVSRRYKPPM